jgi:phosphotransferase system HPr (HPr) family protein
METRRSRTLVVVGNPQGLHARPADLLVKAAQRFTSRIEIVKQHERVDGKSILAILTLAAVEGTPLAIEAEGDDAEQAVAALAALFASNFREEDEPPAAG